MKTGHDLAIAETLGSRLVASRMVGGGCIHQARRLDLSDGRVCFVKSGSGAAGLWLEAEARGLALLAPVARVPALLGGGTLDDGTSWLALEWLDLRPIDTAGWEDLGRQLAAMHGLLGRIFGLDSDNFIGATPQSNRPDASWLAFYLEQRLRPQIGLARANGYDVPEKEILGFAERRLVDHKPRPSLLHGDLWSGNAAALAGGGTVVFDPAPYFGDAETDLAMLELFGGPLPSAFFQGYGAEPDQRAERRPVYDLYHALNHLNLFGDSYAGMVRNCLRR